MTVDAYLIGCGRTETEESDAGRPYEFTTGTQLLVDFWREVKRVMDEKEIPNDL